MEALIPVEVDMVAVGWLTAIVVPLIYLIGVFLAVDAIMRTRTAQGATAWVLALLSIPFLSIPLYWVFGRAKFRSYVKVLRTFDRDLQSYFENAGALGSSMHVQAGDDEDERTTGELAAFENLATLFFTHSNKVELLIDGDDTFDALFRAFDEATDYILLQFYIIRDDETGREFKRKLIEACKRGVRVYLIYDEVGCYKLTRRFWKDLRKAGAEVSSFSGNRSWLGRFRLNFRNHRKIVVVDGRKAFTGGLNIGDEYRGQHKRLSPWRDTFIEVAGPVVFGLQLSFVRDWYYGSHQTPEVVWEPQVEDMDVGDRDALVLASGPADELETCGLLFTHAIESAESRVWIASPYFVPDARVLAALQLAALRGVDVRILMPRIHDHFFFKYVPYAYLPEAEQAGVKIFLYEEGFMHQKAFLVDDDYAAVSTANFDNRSFLYNFEVTVVVRNDEFCTEVSNMFEDDFQRATILHEEDLTGRSYFFRFATQVTRLFAPVL